MTHLTCQDCPDCEGTGEVYQETVTAPPYIAHCQWYECQRCGGEGVVTGELVEEEGGKIEQNHVP
jgi:DnaJ-class molecular chaperone